MEIKAVSKQEVVFIDQAIINGEDPFAFWNKQNPHIELIKATMQLEVSCLKFQRDYIDEDISEEKAKDFINKLLEKIAKDKIINGLLSSEG